MEGNTTALAADTVWINVGAVRGAAPELDPQLLEFSQRMPVSLRARGVVVPVHDRNDAVEIDSSELQGVDISLEVLVILYEYLFEIGIE